MNTEKEKESERVIRSREREIKKTAAVMKVEIFSELPLSNTF